jgi:fibro-slime domain-containing protein
MRRLVAFFGWCAPGVIVAACAASPVPFTGIGGDDASSSGSSGPPPASDDAGVSFLPSGDGGGVNFLGDGGGPTGAAVDAGSCSPNLTGRLRDFVNKPGFMPTSALDEDFENEVGDDRGLVETDLGSDQKPVYAHGAGPTATTHGQTLFDYWYRDTPGINIAYPFELALTGDGGVETYDDQEFFPLDGRGWDDEYTADDGMMHNFSFTFELHTTFEYMGSEVFTFTGDDDVFVFINNKLVVDLGGVHTAETKSITLASLVTDDASATPVPLALGTTYPFDIFYNERHTVSSHFRMDTSISFNNCNPIVIPK